MVYLSLNAEMIRAIRCRDLVFALDVSAGKTQFPGEWFQWVAETPRRAAELQLLHMRDVLSGG